MSVQGAKHILELDLAPGSEGWKLYIEPAHEFLFNELRDAGCGGALPESKSVSELCGSCVT